MSEIYTPAELKKMKMAELKKLLKERGLSTTGNKSNLLERLSNTGDTSFESSDKDILEDDSVLDDTTDIAAEDADSADVTEPAMSVTLDVPVKIVQATPTSSTPTQPVKMQTVTQQPASEGMSGRLKRFGVVSEQAKKAARLERFQSAGSSSATVGTVNGTSSSLASDADVRKKRAERFGTSASAASSTVVSHPGSDVDVLKKRAERFGAVTSSKLGKVDEEDRVLKRKARFGTVAAASVDVDEEDRVLKRKARFGTVAAASVDQVDEGDRELKRKARFGTIAAPSDSVSVDDQKKRRLKRFGAAVAV